MKNKCRAALYLQLVIGFKSGSEANKLKLY